MVVSGAWFGFMPRATITKMIPMMTRPIPEKDEAVPIHQYHGRGTGAIDQWGPPIRPSINRKIPRIATANPSVWRVYLSNRGNVLPL
jgi:hypothetical protein